MVWEKQIKKTIYLLNVNGYSKEITDLTYPFIELYARKIGAEIFKITERKFPDYPITYEKLQVYELAKEHANDWNIYIDSDALIHPETIDFTQHMTKDTIAHNGTDFASIRWKYDRVFLRDGRNIGSCNWFTIASDWCVELWKPIEDMTKEEMISRIFPTVGELNTVITPEHLIDDYALSRNIATYGLKAITLLELGEKIIPGSNFLWHMYDVGSQVKILKLKQTIRDWEIYNFLSDPLKSEIAKLPSTLRQEA